MYFVLNQEKNIIAIDHATLQLFHAKNIMELYQKTANGLVEFYIKNNLLAIVSATATSQYEIDKIDIVGLLGENELIVIKKEFIPESEILDTSKKPEIQEEIKIKANIETKDVDKAVPQVSLPSESQINIDAAPIENIKPVLVKTVSKNNTENDVNIQIADSQKDDDNSDTNQELLDLLKKSYDDEPKIETKQKPIQVEKEIAPIDDLVLALDKTSATAVDLIPPVQTSNKINLTDAKIEPDTQQPKPNIHPLKIDPKIDLKNDLVQTKDDNLLTINIQNASEQIGLSTEDYKSFFKEYIQTAKKLRTDLEGGDNVAKDNALEIITHLAATLNAPAPLVESINSLKLVNSKEKIDTLYGMFDKISIQMSAPATINQSSKELEIDIPAKTVPNKSINIETKSEPIKPTIAIETKTTNTPEISIPKPTISITPSITTPQQNRDINLDGVMPARFEFSIEKSSEELALPKDIVKDFMKDFTGQCRIEFQNIIEAYKEKDMEKIKKISHSLKGVASNLYLTPFAESLLHLQHNQEISKVPGLVEHCWANFISFENQIKNM